VKEIKLEEIKTSKGDPEDEEKASLTQWDEFLSLAIPTQGRGPTPLSIFSLSDSGQSAGHHARYKTFMIVPERFKEKVSEIDLRQLRTYAETTKLPMDIVVRVDFTGPIPAQDLLFLEKTPEQIAAENKKALDGAKKFDEDKGI
jgi:hypothetical protein